MLWNSTYRFTLVDKHSTNLQSFNNEMYHCFALLFDGGCANVWISNHHMITRNIQWWHHCVLISNSGYINLTYLSSPLDVDITRFDYANIGHVSCVKMWSSTNNNLWPGNLVNEVLWTAQFVQFYPQQFFSVLAKKLAGKSICKMTWFVLSEKNHNFINQHVTVIRIRFIFCTLCISQLQLIHAKPQLLW